MTAKGIITRPSPYTVKETIDRLEALLKERGVTIYARINQQEEAGRAGLKILPLQFMMFGNPKAGGPLMAANALVALDLPLKVIAWQDAQQKTWLAYNEETYIEERYSVIHQEPSPLNLGPLIDAVLAEKSLTFEV